MSDIINDFNLGLVTLSDTFSLVSATSSPDFAPSFQSIGSFWIVSFVNLEKVQSFNKFTYTSSGEIKSRFLDTHYRISRNGVNFTEWLVLDEDITNFPHFDPLDNMWIDIKFERIGTKTNGEIRLLSYFLEGSLLRKETEGNISLPPSEEVIIKAPFIFKVFRIDDFEVLPNSDNLEIYYRFSQDSTRTWSDWELLTKQNISTRRISPIRFFQIEYKVKNTGNLNKNITDINLIGDFQNVTQDYQKTNLYGIRECCLSNLNGIFDANGNFIPSDNGTSDGAACSVDSGLKPLTDQEKANLYNPYQQAKANELLNVLSNSSMEVFGHRVQYFVTDPDGKGIDYTLHEFGLFNISCEGELKVAVENNQFPDNQISMNQFDLNLFDSFEIHITKEGFKKLFGVQRRPSKEDLVYFCDLNRLYIVDHAQQFRGFNNYSIYYKVILRKYNKSANVKSGSSSIENRINELTKNSTIDELFGIEAQKDKAAVANKKEQLRLTKDPIRVEISGVPINSLIVKELIENSNNVISKQHYDFSNALIGGSNNSIDGAFGVVSYTNIDSRLEKSDNISFFIWFNLNNYLEGEVHNLFHYYDSVNSLGWKIDLTNDIITTNLNSATYSWNLSLNNNQTLYEGVWYAFLMNLDQRNKKMTQ
jgi:hypothetical protein